MLGNFARLFDDGLKVFMTASLDKKGADFMLRRFYENYSVQFKCNMKNDREYPDYITVVEAGPDKEVFQGKFYLPSNIGSSVLADVLVDPGAYEFDEYFNFVEIHPEFISLCDDAWRIIKN